MTRRRLAALVALTLLAGACSSGSKSAEEGGASGDLPPCPVGALADASGPIDVVVWHTTGAKTLDTLEELVEQYNASQTKVRVRLESQGTTYDEIQQKFNAAVADRKLPAVLMVDDTFTQSMADSGVILPAQSCIEADDYDMSDFRQVAKDYYTIDDVLWPASANLGNILFVYNVDHFRKAGLDPDKPPTTLAEIRDYAERIKAAGAAERPFVHALSPWKTEFWLTGARSAIVNNDNGRGEGTTDAGALDGNEEALELFRWFRQMTDDGLMEPISDTPGQINQFLAMAQQRSSMLIESSGAATSVEAFLAGNLDTSSVGIDPNAGAGLSGFEFRAAVLPGLSAETTGKTQMGGSAWYLTSTTPPEVQAAAWDFMKFMNSPDAQARMLIGGSFLPYRTSVDERDDAKRFYGTGLAGPWLKLASDQVSRIDPTFPGPLVGPYDEVRKALREWQDKLLFSGVSPEDALAGAQAQITESLRKYEQGAG